MLSYDGDRAGATDQSNGVQVTCRLRGVLPVERVQGQQPAIQSDAAQTNSVSVLGSPHTFAFDHVFPSGASQRDVFVRIGAPCVRDFLLGFNCTLLAYGQTGSGKTFTTVGNSGGDQEGLLPRMLELLFASVDEDVSLMASFVEVYQERLRDLLVVSSQPILRLREEKGDNGSVRGVWVEGATEISLLNLATARATLSRGLVQRTAGATMLNRDSSRSHAVFAVTMLRRTKSGERVRSRLCVVDLAGSEQAKITNATGIRLDEAKHINRSLSALGNVIHALTDGKRSSVYVPYRDSKLTRLLQTSFGGNAKTHLLLTCSIAACHIDETLSTLRFGARAKRMKNQPTVNSVARKDDGTGELLETLQRKIDNLCRYICELEAAVAEQKSRCWQCQTSVFSNKQSEPRVVEDGEVEGTRYLAGDKDTASLTGPMSSDVIMKAEITALRQALHEMEYLKQHEQLHASSLRECVNLVASKETEKVYERQAHELQRLDMELNNAEAEISSLQQQLRSVREEEAESRRQLHHQDSVQRREIEASNAEAEILRKQLEHSNRVTKLLQIELAASRTETSELRRRIERTEVEMSKLVEINESLQLRIHSIPVCTNFKIPPPRSKCELRR